MKKWEILKYLNEQINKKPYVNEDLENINKGIKWEPRTQMYIEVDPEEYDKLKKSILYNELRSKYKEESRIETLKRIRYTVFKV